MKIYKNIFAEDVDISSVILKLKTAAFLQSGNKDIFDFTRCKNHTPPYKEE